jgi:thiosulfate dehydrogenase (quinone) large subunit
MASIVHGRSVAASGAVPTVASKTETVAATAARYVFAGVRLALGWTFLWAFLDKLFGLGHETTSK